jgi:glycosyltransferase involved in cell wall biosynthesis
MVLGDPSLDNRRPMTARNEADRPRQTDRPRILEVLYSFRIGGSEVVGLDLARQLADTGCDVICSAIDGVDGPLRRQCAAYGLPVVDLRIPAASVLGRNGYDIGLVRRLRALKLDAVHLQHLVSLNKLGVAARLAGIRHIVVTEHSDAGLRDSLAGRLRARLNWRLAHRITVIHAGIADYLAGHIGVNAARMAVIPLGIDVAKWHRADREECRRMLGLGPETTFIFVGRIAAVKNVPGLIRAFLEARTRAHMPATLLVVGDGADMAECRALAAAHPAGTHVKLLGEQGDTRPFLAAADALVLNSRSEGTPRALLEAMCMGLPGICPAVGGITALLKDRGWLTDPNDGRTLVDALLDAMANPAKIETLGELARTHVAGAFDAGEIARCYRRLLVAGDP